MAHPVIQSVSDLLVTAAIDSLADWVAPYTKRDVRTVVVSIAEDVRQEHLELISRSELARDLDLLDRRLLEIENLLRKPGVARALRHTSEYATTSGEPLLSSTDMSPKLRADLRSSATAQTKSTRPLIITDQDFHRFYWAWTGTETAQQLPNLLHGTSVAAQGAKELLGLGLSAGNVKAWDRVVFPPKTLLAAYGTGLYRELYQRNDGPNEKNVAFSSFLALVWEFATGERNADDWSQPLRAAQGKPKAHRSDRTYLDAQFKVIDRIRSMRDGAGAAGSDPKDYQQEDRPLPR